jgi:hypothetical protein
MTQQELQAVDSLASDTEALTYQVQPTYAQKFKEPEARDLIQDVMKRKLGGAYYHPHNTSTCAFWVLHHTAPFVLM